MSQFWGFHVRFRKLFVFKKKLRIRSNVYCKSCWSNFQFFITALQALYHQEKVKDTIKRLLQKLLVEFPVFHCGFASSLSSSYWFNQNFFAHVLKDVGMCYPKKRSIDFTFFCVCK
ncbi:uncharacterized protein [Malus domestica]|uniref:uncharacterized protein isoform X1 n=1 Tax=Malus domestica TaxID=3750 RepID=UPI003975D946